LKARKFQEQLKELKIKLILYNISKNILTLFIWIGYRGFPMKIMFISYYSELGLLSISYDEFRRHRRDAPAADY
jgi:hypothetical protein